MGTCLGGFQKRDDVPGFGLPENELNHSISHTRLVVEIGQGDLECSIPVGANLLCYPIVQFIAEGQLRKPRP